MFAIAGFELYACFLFDETYITFKIIIELAYINVHFKH